MGVEGDTRTLVFSWQQQDGVDEYRLYRRLNSSGRDSVASNIPGDSTGYRYEISVPFTDFRNIEYRVDACNEVGCRTSERITVNGLRDSTIGRFGEGGSSNRRIGSKVSLSGTGKVMALNQDGNSIDIYRATQNIWALDDTITPTGILSLNTPRDLDLSGGGNRLALTTEYTFEIWTRNAGTGTYELTYQYVNEEYDGYTEDPYIGQVAISGNGRVAAIAFTYNPYWGAGGAIKFCVENGEWDVCEKERSFPSGWYQDYFGSSVALNNDGSIMAVGADEDVSATLGVDAAPFDHVAWWNDLFDSLGSYDDNDVEYYYWVGPAESGELATGAVYVFGPGNETTFIKAPEPANTMEQTMAFGGSVDLSGDGDTLAVGAIGQDWSDGAIYLYRRSGGEWVLDDKLGGIGDECDMDGGSCAFAGQYVSLSDDGNTMAYSCPGCDPFLPEDYYDGPFIPEVPESRRALDFGAPLIWQRSDGQWSPFDTETGRPELLPPVSFFSERMDECFAGDDKTMCRGFGQFIEISDNGLTMLISGDRRLFLY